MGRRPVIAATDAGAPTGDVALRVLGTPVPQGQISHNAAGHGYSTNDKRLKPWRAAIVKAVLTQAAGVPTFTGPVALWRCRILLPRPKKHYRTGRFSDVLRDDAPEFPTAHNLGDLDKHVRSVLDGLTEAGLLADDALVVRFGDIAKVWADGVEPGAYLEVGDL